LSLPRINEIAKAVLRREGVKDASISVVFVTARTMRSYNNRFMHRNYATDVLAFDLSDDNGPLVGDVLISTDAAQKNAKCYHQSTSRELCLYMIHGILHLTGYDDHDHNDIVRMQERENVLLESLGQAAQSVCE